MTSMCADGDHTSAGSGVREGVCERLGAPDRRGWTSPRSSPVGVSAGRCRSGGSVGFHSLQLRHEPVDRRHEPPRRQGVEGAWVEASPGGGEVDLGVGRFRVREVYAQHGDASGGGIGELIE